MQGMVLRLRSAMDRNEAFDVVSALGRRKVLDFIASCAKKSDAVARLRCWSHSDIAPPSEIAARRLAPRVNPMKKPSRRGQRASSGSDSKVRARPSSTDRKLTSQAGQRSAKKAPEARAKPHAPKGNPAQSDSIPRQSQPRDRVGPAKVSRPSHANAFPIVGIGASAGGLEALGQFLKRVPE